MSGPHKHWMLDRILSPVTFGAGPVDRIVRFFSQDVWRSETRDLPALQRPLHRMCRIGYLVFRGFIEDRVVSRASALTYITALSLIPMLALIFSVLKGFGAYQRLIDLRVMPFLNSNLGNPEIPGARVSELRYSIEEMLRHVEGMDFAGLGSIGFFIVLWAAMRLLGSVESAFNDIWGVTRSRTLLRRVSDYLTIVIVTPLLLALTTLGQVKAVMEQLEQNVVVGPLIEALTVLAPVLSGWLALTFLYTALPNTRTSLVSSLIGGLVAGILWALALKAHLWLQIGVANYNAFYAGFAAIPVFLVWVQVSWVIVLLGAEVAFAHEYEPSYRGLASYGSLGHGAKEVLALRAMARMTRSFVAGEERLSTSALAAELGVAPRAVEGVLHTLQVADLVVHTEDVEAGATFVLARDPERVTLKMVVDALKDGEGDELVAARGPVDEELDRLIGKLDEEQRGSVYNLSLRELVRRVDQRDARTSTALAEEPGIQPS